ncbi:MAG: putative sulfate exporter family transporter [Hyphomonas sp.]|nr:putative sulfate exporter family transporter [Hyphomonas sp.]MBB41375.1 putative sulfate exporter family transporter [Hyphomonas sp.]|tara:strand:+ start:4273 stop:5283 length:1011 start_codon:yes stop_codon:yes gene_type:complete
MLLQRTRSIMPGLVLAALIALLAAGLQVAEVQVFGRAWFEALVLAILLGVAYHTVFGLHDRLRAGVHFSSKLLLEAAIVLLGASVSAAAIGKAGLPLVAAIAGVVFAAIAISYGIGRVIGLPHKLALLVACGNSICGNSAIVAAAPVIEAESEHVTASIAFTAALGILVVLFLPLFKLQLDMSERQYGVLAGLTVYAVPQVLAATAPVGLLSTQVGTLVKLIRVLLLGPVILLLGLAGGKAAGASRPGLGRLVPWFIIGFLAMMALRSANLIPVAALPPIAAASTLLTLVSMAALGLMVDLRSVIASGGRVLTTGVLSLAVLIGASFLVLTGLQIQ